MAELTHFDDAGAARMVDVGAKPATLRTARAAGYIAMQATTLALITAGAHAKGDVLGVARLAAIMAAKRTADLVPLCHPLLLTRVEVTLATALAPTPRVICEALVETHGPTGVEMEALCAVQVGLLTVYDMCKAVERGMMIHAVRLLEKTGGRSGRWQCAGELESPAGECN